MAGFRARSTDPVDLQVVPYPAVTVVIDLGDGVLVDDASGRQQRGSVVAGLAPGTVRGRGRDIECLQLRLSPVARARGCWAPLRSWAGRWLPSMTCGGATRYESRSSCGPPGHGMSASRSQRPRLLDDYEAGRAVDPEVAFAWEKMVTSRGQARVERLAAEIGWSRKRLWSRFRSQIGITPKRAAQLIRFDPRGPPPRRGSQRRPRGGGGRLRRPVPPPSRRRGLRWGNAHGRGGRAVARGRRHCVGCFGTHCEELT